MTTSQAQGNTTTLTGMNSEALEKAEKYNARQGSLTGYDCPTCNNKGFVAVVYEGEDTYRLAKCHCMVIRKSMARIKHSGLSDVLDKYTFDRYQTNDDWQKRVKRKAMQYAESGDGWFFIGGQVGCGKTHICTAIVSELLKKGTAARYMLWRDEMTKLQAIRFNDQAFEKRMRTWKTVPVLYVDDLFKTNKPSDFEVNATFEIINARYNQPDLRTIVSSEKQSREITDIDEAIGSRIVERSKGYRLDITRDDNRNQRMRHSNAVRTAESANETKHTRRHERRLTEKSARCEGYVGSEGDVLGQEK